MKYRLPVLILIVFSAWISLSAQGWERLYPDDFGGGVGLDVKQTQDGGYIMVGGLDYPTGAIRHYIRLTKTDAEGEVQWEHIYNDGLIQFETGHSVWQRPDGGYVIGGSSSGGNNYPDSYMLLMRTNAFGDTLWTRTYDIGEGQESAFAMHPTSDGGFVLAGVRDHSIMGNVNANALVVKTDGSGVEEWVLDLESSDTSFFGSSRFLDIAPLSDGGYIAAGECSGRSYLVRISGSGDTLWTKKFQLSSGDRAYTVLQTADGGFLMGGSADGFAGPGPYLLKTDSEGNEEWQQLGLQTGLGAVSDIEAAEDGGYIFTGSQVDFYNVSAPPSIPGLGILGKVGEDGAIIWSRWLSNPQETLSLNAAAVDLTDDGGLILTGGKGFTAFLLKTDGLGFQISNWLEGTLAIDGDDGCDVDDGEEGLENWLVEIAKADQFWYALTDTLGRYRILLDTGSYVVKAVPPNAYWSSCTGTVNINLENFYDTTTVDFPVTAVVDCPLLDVEIGAPFLRRCFDNTYTVQYCNTGTTDASDALVEVTLDPFMSLVSAELPFENLGNGLYSFDLGTVAVGDCGSFQLTVHLDCDGTVIGQTHCVEAHIFPDSLCVDPTAGLPLIELSGGCQGDTVFFIIENTGPVNMQQPATFIVIEDDVMYMQGDFQLDAGEQQIVPIAAPAGTFYRIETDLTPGIANDLLASAFVLGCGNPMASSFANWYPPGDDDPFLDIDCRESIGSYDPNDKQAFPRGYGEEHYIRSGTEIDYLIRFQNTGTDTAFFVQIRDTLSNWLDPATFRPGTASHSYQYELLGEGILKFTFDNIQLPDSNVNEAASNGFVKFSISPRMDVPLETRIDNQAAIYFDFNSPVITNTAFHTIGEDFIDILNSVIEPWAQPAEILVFPNPLAGSATIRLEGAETEQGRFFLFDLSGRLLRRQDFSGNEFQFEAGSLSSGFYLFRLESDGRLLGSGKIVVR